MKSTYLFCTKLRVYWCVLPVLAVLLLSIKEL